MKRRLFLIVLLFASSLFAFVGCENYDDNYSTDFSGMWALVADYDSEYGNEIYDTVDEVLSFEGGRIKYYTTRSSSGYAFENGYMNCSEDDLYDSTTFDIELHQDKCYVYYEGDEEGYIQIKGNKLYWHFDQGCYELYERIKGFTED